jgi:alkanesulfonate monooxygenase SsuD/methylene tetrahydromethanopterin reductase-like flavin-dependent oxidoreductase (luciferase family)
MERIGRDPDSCKILFMITPILGATDAEAEAESERMMETPGFFEQSLVGISGITEIDFSQFPLDEPLPELTTNGERGSLNKFVTGNGDGTVKTLRQLIIENARGRCVELIGTPDTVADKMGEIMEAVGGDGFLISRQGPGRTRKYIAEITDGLIPALQRRGLTRTAYPHEHFRDNLKAF